MDVLHDVLGVNLRLVYVAISLYAQRLVSNLNGVLERRPKPIFVVQTDKSSKAYPSESNDIQEWYGDFMI